MLGWSGVWAWDPVENASFLPWLTGTAYIHSVLVQQRRGMLRVWNLSLLVATFALTILGTFLTRSGVMSSVHAFGAGEVDGYLLGFFGVVVVASLGPDRVAWRPAALARRDRLAAVARGRVPRQQRRVHGVRVRRAARHGVPADRRGDAGPPHRGRGAVLRPVVDPDRHHAAVPDGGGARAAVAQGQSQELLRERLFWPAWCGAGVLAVRRDPGCRRVGAAGRVRARRVRRRCRAATGGARHTPPGLARAGRARQRRHDRARRGDPDRGRAGGVERVHEVGRARPRAGHAGRVGRPHVRARRRRVRADRPRRHHPRQRPDRRRARVRPGDDHLPAAGHVDPDAQRHDRPRPRTSTSRSPATTRRTSAPPRPGSRCSTSR